MDNLEIDNQLIVDAWVASSKAIVETLGDHANRGNIELVAIINSVNFITSYDRASVDEMEENKEEFLFLVNRWIDFKKQEIISQQGKFQA